MPLRIPQFNALLLVWVLKTRGIVDYVLQTEFFLKVTHWNLLICEFRFPVSAHSAHFLTRTI